MNQRTNISDLSKNTRTRLVASVKASLATLTESLDSEITRLNANDARPIHRANDLAELPIGAKYLEAPENITGDEAWASMLSHLYQDVKQLQRKVLRAEKMARQK